MSPLVKYNVRRGTIDQGKKYEIKVAALLALRCALQDENMCIACNVDNMGAFDDVVLRYGTSTFFVQVKHKENAKTVTKQELEADRGDFSLKKYFNDITQLNTHFGSSGSRPAYVSYLCASTKNYFVIFTNRSINDYSILENADDDALCILNGSLGGKMHKRTNPDSGDDIYLITNQTNAKNIDQSILEEIDKMVHKFKLKQVNTTDVSDRFVKYMTDWAEGRLGGHYCLTKEEVLCKLCELLLGKYILNLSEETFSVCDDSQITIWREVIDEVALTMVSGDETIVKFLTEYVTNETLKYCSEPVSSWTTNLSNVTQDLFYQNYEDLKENMLKITSNCKKLALQDFYTCLWLSRKLPVLLTVTNQQQYDGVMKILEGCNFYYETVLIDKSEYQINLLSQNAVKQFLSLEDLDKSRQEKILEVPVLLQGRAKPSVILKDFTDRNTLSSIKVKDIIYILTGIFNIGDNLQTLPDVFVEMSLKRVWLKADVIKKVKEVFAVQHRSTEDFNSFLNRNDLDVTSEAAIWNDSNGADNSRIILFQDDIPESFFEDFPDKTIHILVLHSAFDKFEWVKSYGSIKNIERYRQNCSCASIDAHLNLNNIISKKSATLIAANPGMGKSVLINYIANNAPTNFWILKLDLAEHKKFLETWPGSTNRQEEALKNFIDELQESGCLLSRAVFEQYFQSKNVIFLLDGYDEVPISYQSKAQDFIEFIRRTEYVLCLTTRCFMRANLEKVLDTFALFMKPFTEEEQHYYLRKYFANFEKVSPENATIKSFVVELLNATRKNLNDCDAEFTGVPLQIWLLAHVFEKECSNYLKTLNFENKHFDLLDLYKYFIDKKLAIKKVSEDLIYIYRRFRTLHALKHIFFIELLKKVNVEEAVISDDIMYILQKDGIIVSEDEQKVSFIHRTFAEYLSAEWLASNLDTENSDTVKTLAKETLKPEFTFVRKVFDRILAKDCPLHLAIINRQVIEAERIINENSNMLYNKDKGGRTFLHLLASSASRLDFTSEPIEILYYIQKARKDRMVGILNLISLEEDVLFMKDRVFNLTPIEYAIKSHCLNIADKMCQQLQRFYQTELFEEIVFYFDLCMRNLVIPEYEWLLINLSRFHFLNPYRAILENSCDSTNLHREIKSGSSESLKSLITPFNANDVDENGNTLLHTAIIHNKFDVVQLLLENEANPNIKNKNGCTALHFAVLQGNAELLQVLLNNFGNVIFRDKNGLTALQLAALADIDNKIEIVSKLHPSGIPKYIVVDLNQHIKLYVGIC